MTKFTKPNTASVVFTYKQWGVITVTCGSQKVDVSRKESQAMARKLIEQGYSKTEEDDD